MLQIAAATFVAGYVAVCIVLYTQQRRMLFPIPPTSGPPPSWIPEKGPVVVYFHGNAESAGGTMWMRDLWRQHGVGFHAVEYPGYGSSPGSPTEDSIYEAAQQTLEALVAKGIAKDRLILIGQSLGTGPAVEMAKRGWGTRLVLLTPFTSIGDTAQLHFPVLPAKWLVKDQFDSASKAALVKVPVLVVHGDADEVVPYELGKRLAPMFPKSELMSVPKGTHNDLWDRDEVVQRVISFVTQ